MFVCLGVRFVTCLKPLTAFQRRALELSSTESYQQAMTDVYGITVRMLRGTLNPPTEAAQGMLIGIRAARIEPSVD